jgi:polysaccharide export outer membrane protein/exopolysaccharide production protein ExoF
MELQNKRLNEITADLLKSQARLDELGQKITTSERLLFETEVIAPRYMKVRNSPKKIQPVYTIARQIAGQAIEVAAAETTAVEPGDTIKIELPVPDQPQVESATTNIREDRNMPSWPRKAPPTLRGAQPGEMPIRY